MDFLYGNTGLDCSVLVLNKHYMAMSTVGVRRAISMLYRAQAEVVDCESGAYSNHDFHSWCEISQFRKNFDQNRQDWISAVNFHFAIPRVIRLLFYDRFPRHEVKLNRRNIFARDRSRCQYCGEKFPTNELSLDHVVPKSLGGISSWENLVCACTKCNCKKGGRTPKQANMSLIAKPVMPKRNPVIHLHLRHERYQSWKQFLDHAYWSVELQE